MIFCVFIFNTYPYGEIIRLLAPYARRALTVLGHSEIKAFRSFFPFLYCKVYVRFIVSEFNLDT